MLRPMLSSASGCSVRMHCRQFTAGPLPARTASLLRPTLFRRNVLGSTLLQDHDQPPPHHQQKLHVPPQFQQHSRSMADYRRPPRRAAPTRVREEERDEERTTQSSLERQQQDGMQAEQPRQASASKHDTGMAALQDTGCRNYMINIYTTMGGCIGVSAVASTLPILGVLPMMPPFYMGLASMIPMMCAAAARRRPPPPARHCPRASLLRALLRYLMYRTDENTNPVLRTGVLALFAGAPEAFLPRPACTARPAWSFHLPWCSFLLPPFLPPSPPSSTNAPPCATGMQGLTLAPAILTFTAVNPLIVPTAFGLTCLVSLSSVLGPGGVTVFNSSATDPPGSHQMYGGATVGALMAPR